MQYTLENNFDGVSAFMGGILGLRETYAREEQQLLQSSEVNIFENLLKNRALFRQNNIYTVDR